MVAAISSSGLGLFGSSVAALGGIGASGNAGVGRGNDRVYVNTATGNLVIQSLDEHLRTVGPDVNLIRTYNSQGQLDDDNGDNWRLNVHQRLYNLTGQVNTANSTIIKIFGDGREVTYEYDESTGAYVSSEGADAHDTLRFSDGTWTWMEGTSRLTETYDAQYRLSSTRDADGNTVSYTYSGALLVRIDAGSGQTLQTTELIYSGNNLTGIRVSSNGATQTLTTYEYDNLNRLSRVIVDLTPTITTDAVTYVTDYTYDGGSRRVASITQSDGSSIAITYELISGQYRVKTYTDGEGRLTTFNYAQPTGNVSGGGVPINQAANGAVLDTTRTTTHALNTSAYTVPNGSWAASVLLETNHTAAAATPRMVFDSAGNGFAVWAQGSDVIVRRYTAQTATWSAEVTLDSSTQTASTPMLAIDRATGSAVVAWVQSDGTASSLFARRYDAATNSWGTVQTIESATGAVTGDVSVSMTGSHAAIGWIQHDGTANSVYLSRLVSGSWTTPAPIDSSPNAAMQAQVAIDSNGNATLLWRQLDAGGEQRIHTRRWNNTTQTFSSITQLDDDGDRMPRIGMDAQGNIFAAWSFGANVRRYDAATGQWGPQVTLQNGTDLASNAELAVDQHGNALVAWMESNGTVRSVYARRYDASTGQWGAATLLQTSGNPVNGDEALTVSLSGNTGIVGWLEVVGNVSDVYAARLSGGSWSAPTLLESGPLNAAQLSSAIDAAGNATVLWQQPDDYARSIHQAQYFSAHLVVPSGATWQSIASTLYGVNSVAAGNALQAAMGGGALVAGTRLSGLPASLRVTSTVPGYYTVRAGDTWAHITQTIYGTTDANAIAQLQQALSNPTLVFGLQLDVPATLNFVSSNSYTSPLQWSQVGTTGTQTYNINNSGLTVPNGSWSPASLLETGSTPSGNPHIAFDAAGNGLAVWVQGSDVIVRRYTGRSASWSAEVILDSSNESAATPMLAIDRATGAAVVAWVQSDGTASSLYTRRYDAATNSWGTTQLVENSAAAVSGEVSLSITGGHAAIGWLQHDGTSNSVYLSRLVNGGWSAPALIDDRADEAMQVQVAIDANGNTTLLWRQRNDDGEHHIYTRRWNNTTQTYSDATLLDGDGDRMPHLGFDAQGNAFALWSGGTQVRRFNAATGEWGPQVSLQVGTEGTSNAELAVDPSGSALAAWQESDGTTLSVYVRRYDAATGQWSAATRVSGNATSRDYGLTVSLHGNSGVVAWVEVTGTSVDAYAARLSGGTWGPRTLLESGEFAASQLSSAIDAAGNATVVWQQADDTSRSIYQAHSASSPYYLVPVGATWQSIASELYGVNSTTAGNALLLAMGGPSLTAGTRLQFLPATLTVTVPVPPFYVVQSGDTWTSIAQALYGTSAPTAISALQTVLGTTTLTPGVRLVVPRTLSYSNTSSTAASFLQTEVSNAAGVVTRYEQDEFGRLAAVTVDTNGSALRTVYQYDGDGNVTFIVEDPAGLSRITRFTYDERGNWLTRQDNLGNTVKRTYDPASNQLLTETSYVLPDLDFSGPLQPAFPQTTRYIYDSEQHLRFVISPQGRVTEHQYDSGGQRILTRSFTSSRYVAADSTESHLQSWAGAQDLTQLERTDYGYDFRGNLLSVTSYARTNANGAGEGTPAITYFIYDQRGQLLQTIDARAGNVTLNPDNPSSNPNQNQQYATTYTYDGLGRVQTTTQWDSTWGAINTSHFYDDANRRITTTLANGLITTSSYNRAGELVKVTNGVNGALDSLGTTTYAYDNVGRLRIVTDPTGVRQFHFYDAAGRKIGDVDGDGSLTQYIYNDANQIVKTVQYAAGLSSSRLASLVSQPSGQPTGVTFETVRNEASTNPDNDRIKRNVYDTSGALIYTIDEAGAVTQYIYDGAARLIETVRYATTIGIDRDVDELLSTNVLVPIVVDHDRRTRSFYDKDGLLIGTLDGEGTLVEYSYDAGGRLIRQVGYANPLARALWSSDFAILKASVSVAAEHDRTTDYFYDGQGRRVGVLDAEGYLTYVLYDVAGNILERTRYDHQFARVADITVEQLRAAVPGTSVREHTAYTYNAKGQVLNEVFSRGTSTSSVSVTTTYSYDPMGLLTSTTRAAGSNDARTTQARYDFLGRVLQELTAEGYAQITAGMSQADIKNVWDRYSVTYAYDLAGRKISATRCPNNDQTNVTLYYHDQDGRLRFEINALGERIEYRYNALDQLIEQVRYTNRISTTGLTGGQLTAELEATLTASANAAEDAVTSFTYKLNGQVHTQRTARTSAAGEDTIATYDYNAFGEVRTATNSYGVVTSYRYDRRGLETTTILDAVPGGLNITSGRTYDTFGRVRTVTDGRNNIVQRYEYDRLGRQIESTDANLADRMVTAYDAFSRTKTVRDALNNTTVYTYDDANRRMTVTTPEGIAVVTVFNEHGQTLSVTAPGSSTTYQYDRNGQILSVSDGLGLLETRTYDRAGRMVTQTDANSVITKFEYDAANRVFKRIADFGGLALTTTYTYDGQGRVFRVDEPGGYRTETLYYRDGRIKQTAVDPAAMNLRTYYSYDREGRTVTVTEGYGSDKPRVTTYEYDQLGRRTAEIVDLGTGTNPAFNAPYLNLRTRYRYDANGNVTRKIDGNGHSTWYVYDSDNRLTHTIDAMGGVTQTVYNEEDRITETRRFSTALSDQTMATLNMRDVVSTTDFTPSYSTSDRLMQFVYDRDGAQRFMLEAINESSSLLTERTYDASGRVTRERIYATVIPIAGYTTTFDVITALQRAGASVDTLGTHDRVSWTAYDLRGRKAFTVDGLGHVVKYSYDGKDNVLTTTAFATAQTGTFATDFASLTAWTNANVSNANNRVTRMWYDATGRLRFSFDAEGYLKEVRYDDAGRQEHALTYAYTEWTPATFSASTTLTAVAAEAAARANASVDQKTTTQYDAAGRVWRVTVDAANSSLYEEYGYDAVGNRTSFRNQKGAVWTYEYDANGRLKYERSPMVDVTSVLINGTTLVSQGPVAQSIVTYIEYDGIGNVRARTEAHGTTRARRTEYWYDKLGRQTKTIFTATGTTQQVESNVAYDALGNAFRNQDVAGSYSYKIYDRLGRVQYEIDEENYVTEYGYDEFGNQKSLKRYARALTAALPNDTLSLSASDLNGKLLAAPLEDRSIISTYDRLNRVTDVQRPYGFNYTSVENSSIGTYFTAGGRTRYEYNAFGDVVLTRELVTNNSYADTFSYYDRLGRKTAQVDAMRYLTEYEYDETGDLKRQIEYARALSQAPTIAGYGSPPLATPGQREGRDREVLYGYDRLNRKVSETQVSVAYTTFNGSTPVEQVGNRVTTYGYDAIGNLVRTTTGEAGAYAHSYTYYDALGRVVATAAPARNRGDGTQITPLTFMQRDEHGYLVEQIEFANSATDVSETSRPQRPAANTDVYNGDRVTLMLVDHLGRVVRTQDPVGATRYAYYNERGQVYQEWQTVTNNGVSQQLTTTYNYDRLGRQMAVIEPQGLDANGQFVVAERRAQYNAFGEIIAKGVNGLQEKFEYDQAGRLWRSNSGDGVVKIFLHDVAGNVTAQIKAQAGGPDLNQVSDAYATTSLPFGVMWTDTRYDLLGRVLEQREPRFIPNGPVEAIGGSFQIGMPGNVQRLFWDALPSQGGSMTFKYRLVGQQGWNYLDVEYIQTDTWEGVPIYGWAGVPVGGLAANEYEYELTYTRTGESSHYAIATGKFNLAFTQLTQISPAVGNGQMPTLIMWGSVGGREVMTWGTLNQDWTYQTTSRATGVKINHTVHSANGASWVYLDQIPGGVNDFVVTGSRNQEILTSVSSMITVSPAVTTTTVTSHVPTPPWPTLPAFTGTTTALPQIATSISSRERVEMLLWGYGRKGEPIIAPGWRGTNTVNFSDVGNGVRVVLDYLMEGGFPDTIDKPLIGSSVSWSTGGYADPWLGTPIPDGGISVVTRARIYDAAGNLVRDTAGTATVPVLTWAMDHAPQSMSFGPAGSSTGWRNVTPEVRNGQSYLPLPSLPAGVVYELTAEYWEGEVYLPDIGIWFPRILNTTVRFVYNGSSVQVLSQEHFPGAYTPTAVSGSRVTWSGQAGDEVLFSYHRLGTPNWVDGVVTRSGGNFSFDFAGLSGEYEYSFSHLRNGVFVQNGGGTIGVRTTSQAAWYNWPDLMLSGLSPGYIYEFRQDGDNNTLLRWQPAPEPGSTVEVRYKTPGASSWAGSLTAEPNGISVNLASLPSAQYFIEVRYRRADGTLYGLGSSSVTLSRPSFASGTTVDTTSATLWRSAVVPSTKQSVDRWGNVLDVTDAALNLTEYRYGQDNQLTQTILPRATIVSTIGGVVHAPYEGNATTSNYYDLQGRLIGTRDGNDNINRATYNVAGQVLSQLHADGGEKKFVFNAFGEAVQVTDEELYQTRNIYDKAGRLVKVARERLHNAFSSNDLPFGNSSSTVTIDAVSAGSVIVESYEYDEAGRRIAETNGENETTRYFYDLHGNLVKRTAPTGRAMYYGYDMHGRKTYESWIAGPEVQLQGGFITWQYDYFGQLLTHKDLGGRDYRYEYYDNTNLLKRQSTAGQPGTIVDIRYSYDGAGHLTKIEDWGVNRTTEYQYDDAGRRIREKVTFEGRVHQDLMTTYDQLNRISTLSDLRYNLSYSYDAVGNRTHTLAYYSDYSNSRGTEDLWYSYDEMNRVTVSQGSIVNGVLNATGSQGAVLGYDRRGLRTSEYSAGAHVVDLFYSYASSAMSNKQYFYDGLGRLVQSNREVLQHLGSGQYGDVLGMAADMLEYDGASRVVVRDEFALRQDWFTIETGSHLVWVQARRVQGTAYDDDGYVLAQLTKLDNLRESEVFFGAPGTIGQNVSHTLLGETISANIRNVGYGSDGVLHGYQAKVYDLLNNRSYNTYHSYQYEGGDTTYRELRHTVDNDGGTGTPLDGLTIKSYNVNGELIKYVDDRSAAETRYFANNAAGQAITAVQGAFDAVNARHVAFHNALTGQGGINTSRSRHSFFANGAFVGSVGQLTGSLAANFDVNYTAISDDYPSSVPSSYVVQQGDTLRIIADRVFGDSNLWYLLADANAIDEDTVLEPGRQLTIPNTVVAQSNSASSFKPFNPAEVIGDTTPLQPIPPVQKKGCGIVGQIFVLVIAVVVTWASWGSGSGWAAALGKSMLGVTATSTGATVTASAIIGGAIAGAAGSAISQGVAIGMGIQQSFDWKGLALSAIGTGVTTGLGASSALKDAMKGMQLSASAQTAFTAAAGNALTQGIAVITDLQDSFSWRNVALSAVAAPIAASVNEGIAALTGLNFAGHFAGGIAGSLVRRAFGGKVDQTSALVDAFGNALGNTIVDGLTSVPTKPGSVQKPGPEADSLHNNPGVDPLFLFSPEEVREGMIDLARPSAGDALDVTSLLPEAPSLMVEELLNLEQIGLGRPDQLLAANDVFARGIASEARAPRWTTDPKGYYASKLAETRKLLESFGDDPRSRNAGITRTYASVFHEDLQPWFGLAVIASSKVGEGLRNSQWGASLAAGIEHVDVSYDVDLPRYTDLDENLLIVKQGLAVGNRAVFEDQYTAYQIYREGGVAALNAVVNADVYGTRQDGQSLLEGYRAWDEAQTLRGKGDMVGFYREADRSLRHLANFEQGTILQPVYETPIEVVDSSTGKLSYSNTLRQAIQKAADAFPAYDATEVNVFGTRVSAKGLDVGDFAQRMVFVNQIADAYSNVYASPGGTQFIKAWSWGIVAR